MQKSVSDAAAAVTVRVNGTAHLEGRYLTADTSTRQQADGGGGTVVGVEGARRVQLVLTWSAGYRDFVGG